MVDLNGILEELIRMDKRLTQLESRVDRQSNRADGHAQRITTLEAETPEVDRWLDRPDGVVGQQVRSRKIFLPPVTPGPVRSGGKEFTVIVAETVSFVVCETFSEDGSQSYGERILPKDQFEAEYERQV